MIATMLFGNLPAAVSTAEAAGSSSKKEPVADDRVYITSTKYNLIPGATETVLTTNNSSGTEQRIGFIMEVDAQAVKDGTIKPVATYKDYQYDVFGMQTVTDQAKAYEKAHKESGEKVFAGINADFYNLNTGEVSGAFVMEGKIQKKANGSPYFAILKDGTAVVRTSKDLSDVQEAVAGNMQIVTNGEVTVEAGDYQNLKYSRTAIGVKENGDIITYVTHGISSPTSCGETYIDVAKAMIAQGCYNAVMLDGGGSATYASKREGTAELAVVNNPSDGTPRTVANALCFASTLKADGEFDHASITPNNEYYTPSNSKATTEVAFAATGIDGSGATCDLPKSGLTWALADDSKDMGEIDAETGKFTAAKGKTGTVNVVLNYEDKVVGTTEIQLVEPDEVFFAATGVSLNFADKTDLGLTVKGQGVELNTKAGDFEWSIKSTLDGVSDKVIGTMDGNTFIAGEKQDYALEGTASVTYKKADGTELTASIVLEIGKMPIVKMDFEDVDTNVRGKDVVGLWDWGTTKSFFSDATEDQVYKFQNYKILYYLQSTTYSSDSAWINEIYETEQPWTENEDGTVTITFEGKEYTGTKEATYGEHGQKWVSFTDENGDGYYWRGYIDGDTWSGSYNAGGGSASAMLGADGYDMYVWHTNANKTSLTSGELHGEGSQIVDSSEGEVRFGEYALKLGYDFRNFSATGSTKNCNTYYRMTKPLVASGSPTGLGMWVYAPEDMDNFWFWTQVAFWNGTEWKSQTIHFRPSGAEKTCQYTGVNWTGWTYVEADLTALYEAGAIVDAEHPIQVRSGEPLILLTYIPGGTSDGEGHSIVMGSRTKGYFYIDNVRFVYGTNVDDMDSPEIIATKANDTALSTEEKIIVNTNDVAFSVDFTDPQGENYSGIDTSATQIYLDGTPMSSGNYAVSADRAQTNVISLANGEHTLLVSICDNFGNKTEKTYRFVVDNPDTKIPVVSIEREEKAELGGDYVVTIKADKLSDIASVSTNITYTNTKVFETEKKILENNKFYDDYGNVLTLGADGKYYDANGTVIEEPLRPNATGEYFISSAVQKLGENLSGTIRNKAATTSRTFTATANVNETVTDDTTILTFNMPIPGKLAEDVKFPYVVTVTYTTKDGNSYTVTTGDIKTDIYAYYSITPGVQVAGAESGTLTINTADDADVKAENVKIYCGTEEVTGTFEGNVFTTDYFVNKTAKTYYSDVYVADTANSHYSYKTVVYVDSATAEKDSAHYDLTLNATTGDSLTTENIVWFANASADKKAVVQYMPKADYEAAVDAATTEAGVDYNKVFENAATAEGTAKLTRFGSDSYAAYINNVKLSGLSAATAYAYRAGDGNTWSKVGEFSTMSDDGSTDFMVVADTQLLGNSESESDQRAIAYLKNITAATADVDFGLQTGDFVDGGIDYTMWDQILGVWEESFVGKDFVHVMGNHENYGTDGSTISSAIFGLDKKDKDFYSVQYGEVYIAVINQTADLTEAAAWLIEDAAKTDCAWKVLTCHQPIYYTNPNGSNDGHHKVLKAACDEAGIDFTFSGHDHSYARTEQLKAGVPVDYETDSETNAYVDEEGNIVNTQGQGTVYYICGDLGEKSRETDYAIVNNPEFHFASTSQEYDALFLTANVTESQFMVNAWNMNEDGTKTLIDTYTMYSGKGICELNGEHELTMDKAIYNADTKKLICERCGEEVDPVKAGYTGFATDVNGADEYGDSQYYFIAGAVRTGFFIVGTDFWYANEDGLIDHKTENFYTNTCTENGKHKAHSPRYNKDYTGEGTVKFTGHKYETKEDGSLVCTVCGHTAIDIADWEFSLKYTSMTYTGSARMPAIIVKNPATGETLSFATDGMGKLTDYTRVWSNNVNVGTATVTIEANPEGDYTNSKGAVVLELRIVPPAPTDVKAESDGKRAVTLTWSAAKQATGYRIYQLNNDKWSKVGETTETTFTVADLDAEMDCKFAVKSYTDIDGEIYLSSKYSNSASVTTGAGDSIDSWNIKLSFTKTTYNGNEKRPTATVTDADGNKMVSNKDYTIKYTDNKNAGTATVTISGKGRYAGTKTTTFSIAPQDIKGAVVEAKDAVYSGEAITTSVVVTDKNGKKLVEGEDYSLEYKDNVKAGTATVEVTGVGNYTGKAVGNFTITEKTPDVVESSVYRVYGKTRYETSFEIANVLKEEWGVNKFDTVILASGNNFPDALAGSYLACVKKAPILMINPKNSADTIKYVTENVTSGGTVYVLGGTAAIPEKAVDGLSGYNIQRLSGADRYMTSLKILEAAGVGNEDILVCTGKDFADSLSASAAAMPILLVGDKLSADQEAFLNERVGSKYYIIGGSNAVSHEIEEVISGYGTIARVYGKTRYETSVEVAKEFCHAPNSAVVASALNYPDGLCGGPLANSMNSPLLLAATKKEAAATQYVTSNGIKQGLVVGGTAAITDDTVRKVFNLSSEQAINPKYK